MAVALAETAQYEEAIRFYDQCLAMNPGVGTVMTNKAVALARLGRYEQAEVLLREALDLDPRDVTAWTNLGLCLSRLRYEQEAIACFEKVRQLSGVKTLRDIVP
jgi:tetratricopeptide (TPR) repeat protein